MRVSLTLQDELVTDHDQGVEPRSIDPKCSALRDRSCPTGQAPTSSVRQGTKLFA